MPFDKRAAQGKTNPAPRNLATVKPMQRLKNEIGVFGCDPLAVIGACKFPSVLNRLGGNRNARRLSLLTITNCVAHQILQQLLELRPVHAHRQRATFDLCVVSAD